MNHDPDFYLTAAGEYKPLAEPRACWVTTRMSDAQGRDYVVVRMHPPFSPTVAPDRQVSSVVLSARHQGESVDQITSWPIDVYVCRTIDDRLIEIGYHDKLQLQFITWAKLYPGIEGAAQDAERHAAALRAAGPPEIVYAQQLRFVGEQDGPPERELKDKLVRLLFDPDERVWRAYLARVDFGPDTAVGVTLCLRTTMGTDDALVGEIGEIFASMFGGGGYMDILFMNDEQEQDLARVCKPFYVRTVSRHV